MYFILYGVKNTLFNDLCNEITIFKFYFAIILKIFFTYYFL
jgi:hypothetical protein